MEYILNYILYFSRKFLPPPLHCHIYLTLQEKFCTKNSLTQIYYIKIEYMLSGVSLLLILQWIVNNQRLYFQVHVLISIIACIRSHQKTSLTLCFFQSSFCSPLKMIDRLLKQMSNDKWFWHATQQRLNRGFGGGECWSVYIIHWQHAW